jgi:hypothetical protein
MYEYVAKAVVFLIESEDEPKADIASTLADTSERLKAQP